MFTGQYCQQVASLTSLLSLLWPVFSALLWTVFSTLLWPVFSTLLWPVFSTLLWPVFSTILWPVFSSSLYCFFLLYFRLHLFPCCWQVSVLSGHLTLVPWAWPSSPHWEVTTSRRSLGLTPLPPPSGSPTHAGSLGWPSSPHWMVTTSRWSLGLALLLPLRKEEYSLLPPLRRDLWIVVTNFQNNSETQSNMVAARIIVKHSITWWQ